MPAARKILLIGPIWPEPRASAAGVRSLEWVRWLLEAGWEVHYASPVAKAAERERELAALGARTHAIAPNDSSFDPWIAELKPDVALFERFTMEEQFGWRVRARCPDAALALDTVDLHFVRRARADAVREGRLARVLKEGLWDHPDALRELASIYRCDLSWIVSEAELRLLASAPAGVPPELLRELGLSYPPAPEPRPDSGRRDFAFIGGFRHEPNVDAVLWLRQAIWPLVRARLPGARVLVYGAYAPREVAELHDPSLGFLVRGQAADSCDALGRHLVNLAPLRFGAGLKGKIADGWWAGTPCVSTSVGAEGLVDSAGGFGGLIADSPQDFADAAARLHDDAETRARVRARGLAILAVRFDRAANGAKAIAELDRLLAELPARRARNLTGRMLAHQRHRATEYFSRYLELKHSRLPYPPSRRPDDGPFQPSPLNKSP